MAALVIVINGYLLLEFFSSEVNGLVFSIVVFAFTAAYVAFIIYLILRGTTFSNWFGCLRPKKITTGNWSNVPKPSVKCKLRSWGQKKMALPCMHSSGMKLGVSYERNSCILLLVKRSLPSFYIITCMIEKARSTKFLGKIPKQCILCHMWRKVFRCSYGTIVVRCLNIVTGVSQLDLDNTRYYNARLLQCV